MAAFATRRLVLPAQDHCIIRKIVRQRVLQVTLRMRPDVKQQDICDELSRALPDATIEWV